MPEAQPDMPPMWTQVLQRQHNALILRLESWLSKLDEQLPPRTLSDWARQVLFLQMGWSPVSHIYMCVHAWWFAVEPQQQQQHQHRQHHH